MSRISKDLVEGAHNSCLYTNGESDMYRVSRHGVKMPNVAIIGAGMAGLRCADVLIRSGARVTLFEARNRVGGRVHQVESVGRLMDLGPNWIHGTEGNPIQRIAERTRTVLDESEEDSAVYDSNGARKTDKEAAELSETVWATIVNAFKYSDEHSEEIDPQKTLLDYFTEQIPMQGKNPAKVSDVLKMAEMWGPFIGDPIGIQSLKFFWLEQCVDGENPFVAGTYKDILAYVSRTAVNQSTINFDTEIVHVDAQANDTSGAITLTTSSGVQHAGFDECVVTTPLGWLKKNASTAFPPSLLPPRLISAIQNLGYGRLEKIYVTFPKAFWLSPTGSCPRYIHFLNPDYVPQAANVPWNQSPVSLAHLPGNTAHPTLLFYLYGPCATQVVESITGLDTRSAEYYGILDSFAQPFYSLLPNFTEGNPACKPVAFLATQWQNDRFAGNGSYTNFPAGLQEADKDVECMRDAGGLGEQVGLWLAGEHTAPFVALGTTTGAYWAGEGVAKRICSKWEMQIAEDEEGDGGEERIKKTDPVKGKVPDGASLNGVVP